MTVPALIDSAGGAGVANVAARQRRRGWTRTGNLWQDTDTAESGHSVLPVQDNRKFLESCFVWLINTHWGFGLWIQGQTSII